MKHYAYESPFKMKDSNDIEYTLEIFIDNDPGDPREWDNICTMVCWHSRYGLGDKHNYSDPLDLMMSLYREVMNESWFYKHTSEEWQDILQALKESDLILIKAINMYDHGGITVSTSSGYPYNDRWDAGVVGFIYVTKNTILKECCYATEENWKDTAADCIEAEMEDYDQYLRGDVYGFKLTKKVIKNEICPHCGEVIKEYEDEEEVDMCWGFYGDDLEENGILENLDEYLKFVEE